MSTENKITKAAILDMPRFRGVMRTLFILTDRAEIAEDVAVEIAADVRSELGRLFPGGDYKQAGRKVAKDGTVKISSKGEKTTVNNDTLVARLCRLTDAREIAYDAGATADLIPDDTVSALLTKAAEAVKARAKGK